MIVKPRHYSKYSIISILPQQEYGVEKAREWTAEKALFYHLGVR